ncbi:MAG: DUF4013 domain-containing protein [Anaerolineae bacterium]|nr:DUF4013 domain-containing protein [Anaerolineae bacterium]
MDIGKSFTYMFDDEDWVSKLAIGGLLALVSIIPLVNLFTGFVLIGYALRTMKNVAERKDRPLPNWDDWGGDWIRGLMVSLGALIYSIPIWVLMGFAWIVKAIAGYSEGDASVIVGICMTGASCLSSLWGLAEAIVLPAAIVKYAMTGDFSSFFRFNEIFRFIGENFSNYIVAILLAFAAEIIAGFGTILCVIGVFFTYFWAVLVSSHLFGQVQAEATPPTETSGGSYGELSEESLSS